MRGSLKSRTVRGLLATTFAVTVAAGMTPAAADYGAMHEPITGRVSSNYNRCDNASRHDGIDIAAPSGTAVYAAYKGTVRHIGWDAGGYGNYVDISHAQQSYWTRYAHLSGDSVSVGQVVERGQRIASSGNTGASTGPHLHLEVRRNGQWGTPLNMDSAYACGKNVTARQRIPFAFPGLPA